MLYLLFAILSSASIALVFKITEGKGLKRYQVTLANYAMAALVSIALYWMSLDNNSNLSLNKVLNWSWGSHLLLGLPTGLFFYLSFILYQKSVKANGAALSGLFGKLGILLPVITSVLLWREWPTVVQGLGIVLAFGSIVWINYSPETGFKWNLLLLTLLLAGGMAEFSGKLFQKFGVVEEKGLFLFVVFATALIISFWRVYQSKEQWSGASIGIGFLVGIPNLLSSWFLIAALETLPATLVFPIYSAGAILVISLGSRMLFNESIDQRGWVGIGITMLALIFMNV